MPCAPIDVDTDTYLSASDRFLDVNGAVCDVVASAANAAGAGGGMAGTDSGGVDWASAYDDAAASALSTGTTLADSLGHIGGLLGTSGDNHAGADASSVPGGPPSYPGTGCGRVRASVLPATPPSADGTPTDPPPGWFLIAHLLEYVWPNGHQDRLHAVAGGWRTASTALDAEADRLSRAIGDVSMLSSPEVDAAVTTCCDVQQSVRVVAAAYLTLAATCDDYATNLDEAHSEILRELAEFVAESAVIQALSAAASVPSVGSSEVAGQAGQAARALLAASRIDRVLERLTAAIRVVTTAVRAAFTRLTSTLATLRRVLTKGSETSVKTVAKRITENATKGPAFRTSSKQLGKKLGKHASDYGKDPSNASDRAWLTNLISDIRNAPEEVRHGPWNPEGGGGTDYWFYRCGNDVVVTNGSGDFVTILRGGITNGWFQRAGLS